MTSAVANRLVGLGWRIPCAKVLAPRQPVILLYHGVPAGSTAGLSGEVFEQHVVFLKRHCEFVAARDEESTRRRGEKLRVLLTFDDGFRNNAEVVAPILRKHRVPAIFFISSRHATSGKYLWFSYLRALEDCFPGRGFNFRGAFFGMEPRERRGSVQRLWEILLNLTPHPTAMYDAIEEELPRLEEFVSEKQLADCYAGMTAQQVADLSADPLFIIGAHTVDHPLLTRCALPEAVRQIEENRAWIEAVCNRPCDTIAYPGGDYGRDVLDVCRSAGFTRGYAVASRRYQTSPFEVSRIGIYSRSTEVLGFKVQWGGILRGLRVPVG